MNTLYNRIAGNALERIGALSDGVFAIAMTLIVLEIRVPHAEGVDGEAGLVAGLVALAPRFVMYAMSFLTLGIFWVGQQTQLSHLARSDRHFAWLQIAFCLAAVALMPFSTSLLGEHIALRTALIVYWFNILLLGVALLASWVYAEQAGLPRDDLAAAVGPAIRRRILIAQALYACGAVLCIFGTVWSIAFIVAIQLNYAFAPKWPWVKEAAAPAS